MKAGLDGTRSAAGALLGLFLGSAVVAAPAAEDIRDIRGPIYLMPAWLLPAIIAGAVLITLAIYGLWRRHRNRPARILLPHEIALQRLEEIGALMKPARAREFSIAASDIVRLYIEKRFKLTATRRTTEEFLRDLIGSADAALAEHRGLLEEFLHQCDFVKFAGQSLTQRNMESLRESARSFVLATVATDDPIPAT